VAILIHVDAHREGKFWVIVIPAVGSVTQAYRRSEIRPMAQDCAALMLGVPPQRVRIGAVRPLSRPDWGADV
jgi:predicted RNase H-like HicB family nuclease